jgi:acyl-[acyl carrier protein]--UDP-N-acetylglucosamine O-acyltransferase
MKEHDTEQGTLIQVGEKNLIREYTTFIGESKNTRNKEH